MEDSSREEPIPKPPEIPIDPMEFLSRSWSLSSLEVSKTVVSIPDVATSGAPPIPEATHDVEEEAAAAEVPISTIAGGNPFSFASSVTSQIVLDRILSHSTQGVSLTLPSGRLSHSSGPLSGSTAASLTDSPPPVSPPRHEDSKYRRSNTGGKRHPRGGSKTMGRWLKDRKEKKKEEARVHNAQLHAAVSIAGVAAAVAAATAVTSAASAPPKKGDTSIKTEAAVASAAALVAAQCAEAAEAMGVERDQLSSVVQSAVNFRTPADVITLTAAAATALRAAATLKARVTKDAWNIAAVIPVDKGAIAGNLGNENRRNSFEGKNCSVDNFLGFGNREFLARGTELLKRTRKGHIHWKIVSVYINHGTGQVMLKMKSKRVVGTITKKKKYEITEVCKNIEAWPGRHLLEGGDQRRYFGLKTMGQRVIEFECWSQQYEAWTQGVAYLLSIASERGGDV